MDEQKNIIDSTEEKTEKEKKQKKLLSFGKKKINDLGEKKEKNHKKFSLLNQKKKSTLEQENANVEETHIEKTDDIEKKNKRFNRKKNTHKEENGTKGFKQNIKKLNVPSINNISIKLQLIVGFVIPIIFVIVVGVVAYQKSATGLIENYEVSAENTISTQMKYMDYGLSLIRDDVVQMKLDAELQSLVIGTYKNNNSKATDVFNKTNRNLSIKQAQNIFINSLYMIPKSDNRVITSTAHVKPQGFFENWIKTEEGIACAEMGSIWVGEHPEIDSVLGNSTEDYIMSYISIFSNNAAVMVADISAGTILESLSGIDITEGAVIGFVTADGRELVLKEDSNEEDMIFNEQEFFKKALEGEEVSGTEYITYNDRKYLFIFNKSEVTGALIVYLVPESKVTASAANIKNITIALVIIASVIAAIIGTFISVNISISMSGIIKQLKKVAAGDLTVQMKVKGKGEFSVLSREIMEVIRNTHSLIREVESIAALVSDATNNVEKASMKVEESSNNISYALAEIDEGVNLQAEDSQDCLGQMDGLSMALKKVEEEVDSVVAGSEETKEIVTKSIVTMEELLGQTKDTIEVTGRVKDDIAILAKKSGEIRKFVNVIDEIADETNLLSLNASIEAARAGEAGRGFAVVAEEIRKLADGSQKAANEIDKVVASIIEQTNDTVQTAERAGKIVAEQSQSVHQTKEVFSMIFDSTEEMLGRVSQIAESVQSMAGQRDSTLSAISSISAVSEETAAASSNVNNIAQGQTDVVDSLRKASEELQKKMDELERVLSVFITA